MRTYLKYTILIGCCLLLSGTLFGQSTGELPLVSGCNVNGISLTTLQVDPVVSLVGDTVNYTVTIANSAAANVCNARITNGTLTKPDGSVETLVFPGFPYTFYLAPGDSITANPVAFATVAAGNNVATGFLDADAQQDVAGTPVYVNADDTKDITHIVLSVGITITKECTSAPVEPGQPVTVGGEVCNTGTATLNDVTIEDVYPGGSNTINLGTIPGETCVNWSDSYTPPIPTNPEECLVDDVATVTAVDAIFGQPVGPESDDATCEIICNPDLDLTKECLTTETSEPGDTVSFEVCVENTGNVPLSGVQVSDGTGLNETVDLAAGADQCWTVTTVVDTCDDEVNTADASASYGGTTLTASDTATCPVECPPDFEVDKECLSGVVEPGAPLTYSFEVENTGLQPITVICSDPRVGMSSVPVGPIAPGATVPVPGDWTYTTIEDDCTNPDVEPGGPNGYPEITNTFTCTGEGITKSDDAYCEIDCDPCVEITKVCDEADVSFGEADDNGDGVIEVCYDIEVENCGNVSLTNISTIDLGDVADLGPGESTGALPYCVQDVQNCSAAGEPVFNEDTVTADWVGGTVDASDDDTCNVFCTPCIDVSKECIVGPDPECVQAGPGEPVGFEWSVVVENCSDGSAYPIALVDVSSTDTVDGQTRDHGTLLPGETAEYIVSATEDCVPPGTDINNDVTASGTPRAGSLAPLDPVSDTGNVCCAECTDIVEYCRTPGFWGQHACGEAGAPLMGPCEGKRNAKNLTQIVLNLAEGNAELCGAPLTNTELGSVESSLEAINVYMKEGIHLQYLRQGAALIENCLISGSDAECNGMSIGPVFQMCESFCRGDDDWCAGADDVEKCEHNAFSYCEGLLDCFNNGWAVAYNDDSGMWECTEEMACSPELCDADTLDAAGNRVGDYFCGGKPAGSSKAGNKATQNDIYFDCAAGDQTLCLP